MRVLLAWFLLATAMSAAEGFVTRSAMEFMRDGNSFHAAGANCYYLTYKSPAMVDAALNDAKALGLRVVRVWGFLDCGTGDPGAATPVLPVGHKDGVYFQYWDATAGEVRINDGVDGLQRLDYVIAKAGELGLTVAVSLVNNWGDFGGMDQYRAWYGATWHDQFYTDAAIRQAYKDYVFHLLTRINTVSHVAYKDDPTVFAWELANEPRCIGSAGHDRSSGWTTATITGWAAEMSAYVKSIDDGHLVAVGDEGFFDHAGATDWAYRGNDGVDHDALIALPDVDYATFHLYPDNWTRSVAWGTQWIADHCAAAVVADKPTVLGEYGYAVPAHAEAERMAAYTAWGEALRTGGGDGSWFWMLASYDPAGPGGRYEDYDHYTVYLDGTPWQPGTAAADDDDALAAQAFLLHGLDNRPPVAVAAASPATGSAPLAVVLDGRRSGDPDGQELGYTWDFGDGVTAGGAAPAHLYAMHGTYAATLTVRDPYGLTATATVAVTVGNRPPSVTATVPAATGTAPFAVDFTAVGSDADGDALAYAWDFGDGSGGTGAVAGHVYAPGAYTATVTVDDGFGGTASATVAVRADAPGPVGGAAVPETTAAQGGCGAGQGLATLLIAGLALRPRRRQPR